MNTIYYGDNLEILRDYIPDESLDLIYLDPPFNSRADYNVIFKDYGKAGSGPQAHATAFEDTWHWSSRAELALERLMLLTRRWNSFEAGAKQAKKRLVVEVTERRARPNNGECAHPKHFCCPAPHSLT